MTSLRFFGVWAMASVASFGAILVASGGRVLAPREDFAVDVTAVPAPASAFQSGRETEQTGFAPTGPFFTRGLVDPRKRGNRALRAYEMSSPRWHVEIVVDDRRPLYRNLLDEPVLELFGLRMDAQERAISDWVQVRIKATEASIELRHPNLENLDPEVPVVLRNALVELDQDGDGRFETILRAPVASCRVEKASSAGSHGVPLREIIARSASGSPVAIEFEGALAARADDWHWKPETDLSGPTTFEFGKNLVAEMTSLREHGSSKSLTKSVLKSPGGGTLHLQVPHQDAEGREWRKARFSMPFPFRMDQEVVDADESVAASWITGREAWLDLEVASDSAKTSGSAETSPPGKPGSAGLGGDGRVRLVAARVEHELRAGGGFGSIEASAATFEFATEESNRIRSAEFSGPVVFVPAEDSNWMEKLFGAERGGEIQGRLELRCREGATLLRPADLPADRDGYEIELREEVRLAVSDGPEILRAARWLRTRCEEPPAEVLAQRDPSEPTNLEPRWIDASEDVRLDHQGSVANGGALHVEIDGWGETAARRLVLTESPHVRVQRDAERAPLDLSCDGPLELHLGARGLERAELTDHVKVEPIEDDPAQLHLRCGHLVVTGSAENELAFEATRDVKYDEGDRHVTCQRLERAANGRISVLGVPAVVSIVHEGEPIVLRALWIGFDEARGTFYALGLAQRVQLEPPASLARFDVEHAASDQPETSPPVPAEPVRIAAHLFAAELKPDQTKVLGIARVSIDGSVSARADWLWVRKERVARLVLGAFGPRRIEVRRTTETERLQGSSRRLIWRERDQALRMLGTPRVRWTGAADKGFDVVSGLEAPSGGERTYDLSAEESLLLTAALVELKGKARVVQVGDRPFQLAGRRIVLDRDPKTGDPRSLRAIERAHVKLPDSVPGAPPLLEVNAHRIEWKAASHELHVAGDGPKRPAEFSFRGQPDSAREVIFDLERSLLKWVRR